MSYVCGIKAFLHSLAWIIAEPLSISKSVDGSIVKRLLLHFLWNQVLILSFLAD